MVHMAIDGMWQVFKLQRSTPRNDFCRIAAKNGILLRLINTLYSLNEATRLASASGGGFPAADVLIPRPRSGSLDPSNSSFMQNDASLYGVDQPDLLKHKHGDHVSPAGAQEPSRTSSSQSPDSRFFSLESERIATAEASGSSKLPDAANAAKRRYCK
nr:MAP3K epsilon protein kinase 1-like [Ipomoea batatas]